MSTEQNKARVQRFYEEFNKGKEAAICAIDELYDPDFVIHGLPTKFCPNLAGFKEACTAVWTGFPDANWTMEDLIAEGDKVVVRVTVRGTHQRDYLGIPATGKVVTGTGIHISRFEDDRLVEDWRQADDLGWLRQLGVIP